MIDQAKKHLVETVILEAIAQRMNDPQDLRSVVEKKPAVSDDDAWDALF